MIYVITGFNGSRIIFSALETIGFITGLFFILLKISIGDILTGGGTIILGILIGGNFGGGGNPRGGGGTFILFIVLEMLSGVTIFFISVIPLFILSGVILFLKICNNILLI